MLLEDPRISAKRIARLPEGEPGRIGDRTVRKYVADLRGHLFAKEAFVHRTPIPGDSAEVDFGESWAGSQAAGKGSSSSS